MSERMDQESEQERALIRTHLETFAKCSGAIEAVIEAFSRDLSLMDLKLIRVSLATILGIVQPRGFRSLENLATAEALLRQGKNFAGTAGKACNCGASFCRARREEAKLERERRKAGKKKVGGKARRAG